MAETKQPDILVPALAIGAVGVALYLAYRVVKKPVEEGVKELKLQSAYAESYAGTSYGTYHVPIETGDTFGGTIKVNHRGARRSLRIVMSLEQQGISRAWDSPKHVNDLIATAASGILEVGSDADWKEYAITLSTEGRVDKWYYPSDPTHGLSVTFYAADARTDEVFQKTQKDEVFLGLTGLSVGELGLVEAYSKS